MLYASPSTSRNLQVSGATTRSSMASKQRSANGSDLQIQDRIYFVDIVRSKISELESEMQWLQRETDSFLKDNQQYNTLSKTVGDLRNELEDYNMARMNSFCDVTELKKEIDDLHAHNQQVELTMDEMYSEKQRKEERLQQLEYKLCNERPTTKNLPEKMNPEFKQRDDQMGSTSNQFQTEICILERQMNQIRQQVSNSPLQQEALSLIEQIYELEVKHDQLINENQTLITSEHQQLTTQIEDDNQEFISLEKYEEDLQQFSTGDIELTHEKCLTDIKNIQKTNLTLLSLISRTLIEADNTQLKLNLDQYEIEKQNSNDTLTILAEQHRKLKRDFIKLETLDQRLTDELRELKIKYTKMQEDLVKFDDLESLKRKAERRKQQLTTDKMNMIEQKQITQLEIQTLQFQFEAMQKQLQDHETHQQLIGLEQKLQTLFTLDENLSPQNNQNQYEQIKHQALKLVHAHNQWLIQRLKNLH